MKSVSTIFACVCLMWSQLMIAQDQLEKPPSSELILEEMHVGLKLGMTRDKLLELSPGIAQQTYSHFYEAREPDGRIVDLSLVSKQELIRFKLKQPSPETISYAFTEDRLRSIGWHRFARKEGAPFSEGIVKFVRHALKTADRKFFTPGDYTVPVLQYHEGPITVEIYFWDEAPFSPKKVFFSVSDLGPPHREVVFKSQKEEHLRLYDAFEKQFKE